MWSSDGESIFLNQIKDDIESLNTDDVLSVLKRERENAMKPNFNLNSMSFQTPFTCELEY